MQYTVYADILFLVNWLMDYALLRAAGAVLGIRSSAARLAMASAAGALWACLISIYTLPKPVEAVLSFLGISSLMVWIAFRTSGIRQLSKQLAVLYAIAVFAGGGINLLYFHTPAGVYLKRLLRGETKLSAVGAGVLAVGVCAAAAAAWVIGYLARGRRRRNSLYTAELFFGGQKTVVQGFVDTGNRLKEPVTGRTVHILRAEAARALMSETEKPMSFLIPYHAVGTENGLLTAIRIDRMELTAKDNTRITLTRPLIGLYEGRLSPNEEYQLILHAETENLTRGKCYDN